MKSVFKEIGVAAIILFTGMLFIYQLTKLHPARGMGCSCSMDKTPYVQTAYMMFNEETPILVAPLYVFDKDLVVHEWDKKFYMKFKNFTLGSINANYFNVAYLDSKVLSFEVIENPSGVGFLKINDKNTLNFICNEVGKRYQPFYGADINHWNTFYKANPCRPCQPDKRENTCIKKESGKQFLYDETYR